jgi:hypothetical protein
MPTLNVSPTITLSADGTTLMIAAEAGVDKLSRDADPSLVPEGLQAENSLIPQ